MAVLKEFYRKKSSSKFNCETKKIDLAFFPSLFGSRKNISDLLTMVYRENTDEQFLRHYTRNIYEILIFPVEVSHIEQQWVKRKKIWTRPAE